VEDESELTSLWVRFLEPLHCTVDVAHTMQEAFEQMKRVPPPDLVFLDLRLPDSQHDDQTLAQIELLKKIHPGALVVVATGYATDRVKELAIKLGADGFQSKIDMNSQTGLWRVIKHLFEHHTPGTREAIERQVEIQELLSKVIPVDRL
jgi:CheY-like chemotaxis protein